MGKLGGSYRAPVRAGGGANIPRTLLPKLLPVTRSFWFVLFPPDTIKVAETLLYQRLGGIGGVSHGTLQPVVPTGVSLSDRTDVLWGGYPMPDPSSFDELPSGQCRQTDYKIARSFQQGQSERHLRRQPEAGAEENIDSLLDPDRVRNGKGKAARGIQQA